MANDQFIEIAAGGIGGRAELLYEPSPKFTDIEICELQDGGEAVKTEKKMDTAEEMRAELKKMREEYAPYLRNLAPKLPVMNKRVDIKEFILDGKEKITIPYYGGPVGYAKQVYETKFDVEEAPEKEIYICIGGADYEAAVMINGEFAGRHEGFFAPFEFNITELVRAGENDLKIVLKNDFIYGGINDFCGTGQRLEGDKLYAATGIGWDDSQIGWHHCPPGMGLYDDVYIEYRNKTYISDVFVRPLPFENKAEVWIEVENTEYVIKDLNFTISVYGQNFEEKVFEKMPFEAETIYYAGMGDSLTQADVKDIMGKPLKVPAEKGNNVYKFMIPMENAKLWEPKTPYLYQVQVELIYNGEIADTRSRQFGMREFKQDLDNEDMKGMFMLNGKKTRLRGANTMGFEQLDVMRGDFDQLIEDILLAKLCNMNYLRITQRPVQEEFYDYCDMLGLMIQTDLPLFGCMRRNKVAEGIRQAEEMEKLIRSHASCVVVTYINEPFPNAKNQPHRHLERSDLENFFTSCDYIVRLNNPDRVIKHVDGDYDPPTEGMPDNHCYPTWYNGHGIDIGKLYKGHWMQVKPGWYYGCGEFGTEGLECTEVMRKYYPAEWLVEPLDIGKIVGAQTKDLHRFFYDTQDNVEDWVERSQRYQALATKLMAESYRRDSRMISFAIHLFIDAWPSGWMKTIMDCDRNPKKAFFTYKNALDPIMVSLRTDKWTYFEGEEVSIEAFICNDTNLETKDYKMRYELYAGDELIKTSEKQAEIKNCDVTAISDIRFTIDEVVDREIFTLKAILLDENGNVVNYAIQDIEVFEDVEIEVNDNVVIIDDLEPGEYQIAGENVKVKDCGMLPLHFVSRKTGHPIVEEFREKDFSYWYNEDEDMITPILYKTFTADGFTPVLTTGNKDESGAWEDALACAVKEYEGKLYVICLTELRTENPVAKRFVSNIYSYVGKGEN